MTGFLRVGPSYFVAAASIEIVQGHPTRPSRRELERSKGSGVFYDATGGKPMASLITLRSGWVVATAFLPETLIERAPIAAPPRASTRRENGADIVDGGRALYSTDREV